MTPDEVRAIAKEAYIYGFPMVDSYRIQHAYFVDKANPEYRGGWNEVHNTARVFTPADKAIQTPNSDTPYSSVGADLRAEPLVITVPAVEQGRYYSVQLVDMYTQNFGYIGSRATGNGAGSYLLVGPNWQGDKPAGIKDVIRSETELAFLLYRTQLFGPNDIENVKKIQAGYRLQPLSAFEGKPAPAASPPIDFAKPLTPDGEKKSLEFFSILNFLLQFAPTDPSEKDLRARFATIGIEAGKSFDPSSLSPEMKAAYARGVADAWTELQKFKAEQFDTKKVSSGDLFGSREYLKGNYLYRMAGAVLGIYGNSKEEAMYPSYAIDESGNPLSGDSKYVLRFPPGQLPPVNAFWSLTMYKMPESLLVENPINRYLLNSPMLPQFVKDPDGGLTFYIQNQSPGKDKEANWLPAPPGPFVMALRLYWPKEEALKGGWKAPPLTKVN